MAIATFREFISIMADGGGESEAPLAITLKDVEDAAERIGHHVHKTPVATCSTLDAMVSRRSGVDGVQLFLKCENMQKSGSFKARGAANAVFSLSEDEAARGVLTQSSGNHAQGLAVAAKARGIKAVVVMPHDAPLVKKRAVEGYGAEIVECNPDPASRAEVAAREQATRGCTFVHPSNDPLVMAGQGTLALELLQQTALPPPSPTLPSPRPLDAIIAPIGGGGMISGVAVAAKGKWPEIRVFAAEPHACDDAFRSMEAGRIVDHDKPVVTVADGLRTILGSNTFPIVSKLIERVLLVEEKDIIEATRLVFERAKLVIEPSSGVGVAAVLGEEFANIINESQKEGDSTDAIPIKRVGIVLCGGNIDLTKLPWL